MSKVPQTLQEAVIYFAEIENCLEFMVSLRWPDGREQTHTLATGQKMITLSAPR